MLINSGSPLSTEDIFSSQEVVDHEPVTMRVMDTFDQVCNKNSNIKMQLSDTGLLFNTIFN